MNIRPIKTNIVSSDQCELTVLLDRYVPRLSEKSILAVTSKIVSLCEGNVIKIGKKDKNTLVQQESQFFIPPEKNPRGITLTITNDLLVPTAGIDESNGNGYYILWPRDPYASAKTIREHLAHTRGLTDVGVLITDSKTTPMRWGTTGITLSYAGFTGINDFIGKPDLFDRPMEVTKVNVADGLAAAAVVCMGESNEQTPLAVITDIPFVTFDKNMPSTEGLKEWQIPMEIDLYGPLLQSPLWKKGKRHHLSGWRDSSTKG